MNETNKTNNNTKRVNIITGHYGSGKTTFSVNYAMYLREKYNKEVFLADIDVVNPYFRSREHAKMLSEKGIKILGSYIKEIGSDLPAVSADVFSIFENKNILGIIDLGGNATGSLSFANFRKSVDKEETEIIFVLNANRFETATLEGALFHLNAIEYAINLKATAIVNNTHLMKETTFEDIKKGETLAKELSKIKNIPIKYTAITSDIIKNYEKTAENNFTKKNNLLNLDSEIFILNFDIKNNY